MKQLHDPRMTIAPTPQTTDRRLELTQRALRHCAEAWEHGLTAALDHDPHEARRVMRTASVRRSMLRTAHQHLLWAESERTPRSARRGSPAAVVTDLIRVDRLLTQLAQSVLTGPRADPLADRDRQAVEVARRIGRSRLDFFATAMPRPSIDGDYIAAGHELLDALAALAESAPRRGSTPDICLELMVALIETSRHATRIA
jgi:hypothetical protein